MPRPAKFVKGPNMVDIKEFVWVLNIGTKLCKSIAKRRAISAGNPEELVFLGYNAFQQWKPKKKQSFLRLGFDSQNLVDTQMLFDSLRGTQRVENEKIISKLYGFVNAEAKMVTGGYKNDKIYCSIRLTRQVNNLFQDRWNGFII